MENRMRKFQIHLIGRLVHKEKMGERKYSQEFSESGNLKKDMNHWIQKVQ